MQSKDKDNAFSVLLVAVCLAFGWIMWPFFGAILWGTVTAIVFVPMHRRILNAIPERPNVAALATVVIVVLMVILPLFLVAGSLSQELSSLYNKVQSGELSLVLLFEQFLHQVLDFFQGVKVSLLVWCQVW